MAVDLLGADYLNDYTGSGLQKDQDAPYSNSVGTATLTINLIQATGTFVEGPAAFSDGAGVLRLKVGGAGTLALQGGNAFSGGLEISGTATLAISGAGQLGTGAITFAAGAARLQSSATALTISQAITVANQASATIAVASGKTLTLTGAFDYAGDSGTALHFGGANNTGTVVLSPSTYVAHPFGSLSLDSGTLKLGNAAAALLISSTANKTAALDGTLDLNGQHVELGSLAGTGAIVNSSATVAQLSLRCTDSSATFFGSISGAIDIAIDTTLLYRLYGTIAVSSLTANGSTGLSALILGESANALSFSGALTVNTKVFWDAAGGTIAQSVSGAGEFTVRGQLALTGDNSAFSGLLTAGGALTLGNAHAAGSAALDFANGTLKATENITIASKFQWLSNSGVVAAAQGRTLTLGNFVNMSAGVKTFGSATDTGTVVLDSQLGAFDPAFNASLQILGGTLSVQAGVDLTNVGVVFAGTAGVLALNGTPGVVIAGISAGAGEVDLNGAQVVLTGDGQTIKFVGGTGNVAHLGSTGNAWANVSAVGATAGKTYLEGNTHVQVNGANQTVYFNAGLHNHVSFVNTGASWDSVTSLNGTTGKTYLTSALAQIVGAGQTVFFWAGTGNAASLINTAGTWDDVSGQNGAVGTTYLTNALTRVTGANEKVYFWGGTGNAVSLIDTAGTWDDVTGANGAVGTTYLTHAFARVTGANERVYFWVGSDNAASLVNTGGTWDDVFDANGATGTTYLTNALTRITGGGERAIFWSGGNNAVSLINTGAVADTVSSANGASGTVYLTNAIANISGGGETVAFWSGASNTANLSGTNYALLFNLPSFGLDTVTGFTAADTLSFNAANQGNLSVTQSGADTLITLDAANVVTLKNYLGAVSPTFHA